MDSEPLVSIIVLSYQNDAGLKMCLESIVNQTYKNIEIIVADDGSEDNSKSIIEEYKSKDNRIIALFHENNKGISLNLNRALKVCKGKYISTIGADDEMFPAKIEKQVGFLEQNSDYSVCFHNQEVFDENQKTVLYCWLDKYLACRNAEDALYNANWFFRRKIRKVPTGSWFARSDYLLKGINDIRTARTHEFLFVFGMYSALPSAKWYTLPELLGRYHLNSGQHRWKADWMQIAEDYMVSFSIAKTRYPEYYRKIDNEEAYWWFIQLLYKSVPSEKYNYYLKIFRVRFGLVKYLYLFIARAILNFNLGRMFYPLKKVF